MKIAYFQNSSLMDYPGYISSIIFTYGCNLRCGFCHNGNLLDMSKIDSVNNVNFSKIINYLNKNKKMINAVTFTGGEPLLNNDLIDYIIPFKKLGFNIKLDTNGSLPNQLKTILSYNLIDYVAMDLKSNHKNYKKICGVDLYKESLKSIKIFEDSNLNGEYRITCFSNEINFYKEIFLLIKGTKKTLYLQQFLNKESFDPDYKKIPNTTLKFLNELKSLAESMEIKTEIRKYF